jgi:hypothetical protein
LAIAQFDPVVTVAQGHREIPLRGMGIHRNFLESVGVGCAPLKSGHIGQAQAELGGS